MNIDELFEKWNALCDAQEHCSECPIGGATNLCSVRDVLKDVLEEIEGAINKREEEK